MIKIVATDMDGTLLNDRKELPERFDNVVGKLFDRNVKFVISSGRSYCALKAQFERYLDRMTFICDNGACVYDCGKQLFCSCLDSQTVSECVDLCNENGYTLLLCGKNGTWHNSKTEAAEKEISKYYNNQIQTDRLDEVKDEIFKIAVFEDGGIENDGYRKLERQFGSRCCVQLSGFYWVDIMSKGVSKGSALRLLQRRLDVSDRETMAFGDYLNDLDMLKCSHFSFAMENAHETVKKAARFITGSNNDDSVIKEICRYCKI